MASALLADDVVEELRATGNRSAEITAVSDGESHDPTEIVALLTELGVPSARARRWAAQCAVGAVLLIVSTSEVAIRRLAEVTFAKYGAETALLRAGDSARDQGQQLLQ